MKNSWPVKSQSNPTPEPQQSQPASGFGKNAQHLVYFAVTVQDQQSSSDSVLGVEAALRHQESVPHALEYIQVNTLFG